MALTYGLIVSDFDGTLRRTEGGISERNVRAIGRYVDAGGVFAFCTGRIGIGRQEVGQDIAAVQRSALL